MHGVIHREAKIPEQRKVRLPEALDRLLEFYSMTEKPEEVKKGKPSRPGTRKAPRSHLRRNDALHGNGTSTTARVRAAGIERCQERFG
jgi:hypothetical protein